MRDSFLRGLFVCLKRDLEQDAGHLNRGRLVGHEHRHRKDRCLECRKGATTSRTNMKRVTMCPNLILYGREEHCHLSSGKPYHSPAILRRLLLARGPLVGKAQAQRGLAASQSGCVTYGGQSRSGFHALDLICARIGSTRAGRDPRR